MFEHFVIDTIIIVIVIIVVVIIITISNGNRIEWSTIQAVIERVTLTLVLRKMRAGYKLAKDMKPINHLTCSSSNDLLARH